MKRAARCVSIWFLCIMLVFLFTTIVLVPIVTDWCSQNYPSVVAERNELYAQVDSLKNNFEEVYNMRNAEIVNTEETVVILSSKRFTLKITFDKSRDNVIAIKEERLLSPVYWIVATLVITTLLYVSYSIGKWNSTPYRRKVKPVENHQK